jgi:glycogen synthase
VRLLFLAPAFPPFPGGGERYVRSLALHLSRLGNQVTVVTTTAAEERDFWQRPVTPRSNTDTSDGPLRLIRCPLPGFPGGRPALFAWRKLMVLLSALPGDQTNWLQRMAIRIPPIEGLAETLNRLPDEFDLIHGFNISWEHPLVLGWQMARRRHRPLVITPFAHLGTTGRDRVARNSTMDHQRRMMSEAQAILTLTAIEKELLARWQIGPGFMTVIGGGLDPLPPPVEPSLVRQRYSLAQSYALFIGRTSFDKGAIHAAQAALQLRQGGQPVNLVLIGQTTPEFDRFYQKLPAGEQACIRRLGVVDESEKHALLAGCEMLLLPSRSDSFGIVFLEAWAHGRPVIGARAGGIPGVVDNGQNGILIPFGDVAALAQAMAQLLTDPALNARMGANGRQKVSFEYTWEQVASRTQSSYEQVLAAP